MPLYMMLSARKSGIQYLTQFSGHPYTSEKSMSDQLRSWWGWGPHSLFHTLHLIDFLFS